MKSDMSFNVEMFVFDVKTSLSSFLSDDKNIYFI
jgi:hypothetical protein